MSNTSSVKPRLALNARPQASKAMRFTQTIKDAVTQDMLKAYLEAYRLAYGMEIDRNTLVEQMILNFMQKDKDFVKFYAARQEAEKPKPSAATNQPAALPVPGNASAPPSL